VAGGKKGYKRGRRVRRRDGKREQKSDQGNAFRDQREKKKKRKRRNGRGKSLAAIPAGGKERWQVRKGRIQHPAIEKKKIEV